MTGVLAALVSTVLLIHSAAAANPPGQEHGSINFYYDPSSPYFIGVTGASCFLVPLTVDERDHVHTNKGMEDLELTMMREWVGVLPEIKIYHDDPNLPTVIQHWCNRHDLYLLERSIAGTTVASPLGR